MNGRDARLSRSSPASCSSTSCARTSAWPAPTSGASTASAAPAPCCWTARASAPASPSPCRPTARESARSRAWPTGRELHPLQDEFWDKQGLQCGYCTPGMLMRACEILEQNPDPTPEQVREGIASNLCRCTGYQFIIEAVVAARRADARRERLEIPRRPTEAKAMTAIERPAAPPVARPGQGPHVGGQVDPPRRGPEVPARPRAATSPISSAPGMLHARRAAQPARARAHRVAIDTAAARPSPGVHAVITGAQAAELADPMPDFGPDPPSTPGAAWPWTRSATWARASRSSSPTAATSPRTRWRSSRSSTSRCPPVVDPERALQDGAPLVHEALGSNCAYERTFDFGDVERRLRRGRRRSSRDRLRWHRSGGQPLETVGAIADFDPRTGQPHRRTPTR